MEKIRTVNKRQILLKTGFLMVLPIPVMLVLVVTGFIGRSYCLFAPGRSGYTAVYIEEQIYPRVGERKLNLSAAYEGRTVLLEGDTILWEETIYPDGMYRAKDEESPPFYTLFWIPTYFRGLPLRERWERELTNNSMIDLTGFFGEPGKTYAFHIPGMPWPGGVASISGTPMPRQAGLRGFSPLLREWRTCFAPREGQLEIFFVGAGGVIAGRASYHAGNGLLLYAVSFSQEGRSLTLTWDNMPRRKFSSLLLPFVLLAASGLAFYEIFWSSIREGRDRSALPPQLEFAILGYTAVLVDMYYDFVFYEFTSDLLFLLIHAGMVILFWHRLGWWSFLPALEMAVGFFAWARYEALQPALAFFPASFAAWFLALQIEGRLSPGTLPKLPRRSVT